MGGFWTAATGRIDCSPRYWMLARYVALGAASLLGAAVPLHAQSPASDSARAVNLRGLPPSTQAAAVVGEIRIDGRLDEAAWQPVAPATDFTESYPDPGAPAGARTEAYVLYDEQAVYVGVRMYDAHPDSIAAPLARRDAVEIYSDWVHVMFDSYDDDRTASRFSVNPRGVQKDVFVSDDGREDLSWDAVWEVATTVDSLGWVAEFRIPLSQLRLRGGYDADRVWGFQVMRDVARREQRFSWAPWTLQSGGFVSLFGELRGIADVRPVRRAELQPYVSTRLTREPATAGDAMNPFFESNAVTASVGADVQLGLGPSLTLTGTINPDFGQVELDPAFVNLSQFEVFLPEQRPFFVERADIFRFGAVRSNISFNFEEYFYSRRIGRSPQRAVGGPDAQFVDTPEQTTILGAAKVTGRAGPWTIGVLDALTGREEAQLATSAGERQTTPVEPRTNYFVGRARRDFRGGNTVLGTMITAAHRDLSDTVFTDRLHARAFFGGVDFEHAWARRQWTLSGYVAGSRVDGSTAVIAATQQAPARYYQRPDADYVALDPTRSSLDGHMAEIALQRVGAWDLSLNYKEASPGFEINDLGFQGRTDYRSASLIVGRRVNRLGRIFRGYSAYGGAIHAWNFGGEHLRPVYSAGANGTFRSFWSAGLETSFFPVGFDDRLTRGGPLAQTPRQWQASAFMNSDARQLVGLGASASYVRDASGGSYRSVGMSLDYRPNAALRLRVGPQLERTYDTDQYVRAVDDAFATRTFGRRYVFADIERATLAANVRLDWTFSPTLSLQLYAQPFIAAGDYERFKEFRTPGAFAFDVYGEDVGTVERAGGSGERGTYTVDPDGPGAAAAFQFPDPSFNTRSLRGNAVLRWEYRPGSALFVVWQQQRSGTEPFGDWDVARDAGAIFRTPVTNVFLVKVTYWLGR